MISKSYFNKLVKRKLEEADDDHQFVTVHLQEEPAYFIGVEASEPFTDQLQSPGVMDYTSSDESESSCASQELIEMKPTTEESPPVSQQSSSKGVKRRSGIPISLASKQSDKSGGRISTKS